jgi:hypothetical protein
MIGNQRLHSITSSAVARSVGGIVNPSAFAVLRLMTNFDPVPRVFPHQLIETRGIVPARPDRRLGENDEAVTPAGCRKPGGQRHALALQLKELPRVEQAISSARQGIATLCRRSLVQFPRREARDVSTTSEPGVRIIPATSEST